ncbi:SdpI family protein [Winogradskyella alexanderae]|uniref:SdpI family protein n=1 Tax=Winogradskyella alexanderae TaxID=2877123 RepID=A0ABS7XT74_9FLAO|nr:SdpI family protein [Winogradskyella alexanderae]MCA0133234.1 SdpI family protein [Winogradskyella alexanderae]
MNIENPLFLIPLSSGLIFCVVGVIMYKFPPKKINGIYGYRTINSMKSQERWDFAQIYSSKQMIKSGFLLSISGLMGLLFQPNENTSTALGLGLMILTVVLLFIKVEKKLKNKFKNSK